MKTSHCDRKRIDDFFRNEDATSDRELTRHLETCAECRLYFDSQAARPELWSEAQHLLQPSEFDLARSSLFPAGEEDCRKPLSTPSIQAVLDLLVPSEDPERLGRLDTYEVSGVIGAGGMGVVLKAFDPSLDRVVAIKVLAPHLANNDTARRRFSREAKAAAAVLHPNVVAIHSVSSDAQLPFLVMAYIRGGSLQKRLNCDGALSTVEVLRIGSQIAAGLAAAHEQGLIHRDIKPENILLEEGVERVTLTDFGLARAVDDTSVTRQGTIAGTPRYMSPEQARGEVVDQMSDLFSLGSVLYTICTGRPPFVAESSFGVMRKISDEQTIAIRELNPDIPDWLTHIIEKLMAKKKTSRFKSASEVRDLLEACLGHLQQPTTVKLPMWLAKYNEKTFAKRALTASLSRSWGFLFMLTLVAFLVLGVCFFPPFSNSSPQLVHPQEDVPGMDEVLGNGYVRKGDFIYFDGQRIDQAGREDIEEFAEFTGLDLRLAKDVDAASFKALSEEYTKDSNNVYYKWVSPGRLWIVHLPKADPMSFEVVGFNLAKDVNNVWWYGQALPDIDPVTVELVNDGFVWKDDKRVWYQNKEILGADAATLRHLEQAFYLDKDRVYWSSSPLTDAAPNTFRTFGNDSPFGADQTSVWKGTTKVEGVDAVSFEAIHQSIYKDKNGVYASGYPVENADPKTFRKIADLDESLSVLLADENHHYVYVPFRGEIYLVAATNESLKVKRQIWAPGTPLHRTAGVDPVATTTAELGANGWQDLSVMIDEATEANRITKDQEAHLLNLYKPQFNKAWDILRDGPKQEMLATGEARDEAIVAGSVDSRDWATNIRAFDKYLSEIAAMGRVPDKLALAERVTLTPGGEDLDSEVFPVTNDSGGFIDMRPAEDTVQFRANEALQGRKVSWEFELGMDTSESTPGVLRLTPKLAGENDNDSVLGSLFVMPAAREESSYGFQAGDIVTLEGTIGDFAENTGIADLQSPSGLVAIYHLDSAPDTVFWVGLKEVSIKGPARKMTPRLVRPSAEVTTLAKELLEASFRYDEEVLKTIYASEVRLLPGNRLFAYGLELPGKMTSSGVVVELDKMLPALKKQAERDPNLGRMAAAFVGFFRIEKLDVAAGEFVTEPNQPAEMVFENLRFTILDGDVLLKISVPTAFRYVQLRKSGEQWKVVAEY